MPGEPSPDLPSEDRLRVPALQAERLLASLAEHGVEFVVIGGFALGAHGVVRGTKDVDVVPAPGSDNLDRLARALAGIDAHVLLSDDVAPGELGPEPDVDGLALGGNWALGTRLGRLDVMQDIPGMKSYATLRERAVAIEVPDAGLCFFAGLDDLVAMKTAAGRPQDEIDVASLARACRRS